VTSFSRALSTIELKPSLRACWRTTLSFALDSMSFVIAGEIGMTS
jgi:hypothetical protein